MEKEKKIAVLVELGQAFSALYNMSRGEEIRQNIKVSETMFQAGLDAMHQAEIENPWFSKASIETALYGWSKALSHENVILWLTSYELEKSTSNSVGVIMAGNIPLVGLHDAICVLLSEGVLKAKLSSKDRALMLWVFQLLSALAPEWGKRIQLTERLNQIQILIATGSNNSARYFEYYFRDKQKIIRKNRTSIAILKGDEDQDQLDALSNDIFLYFGMGCRSITKVFLPRAYNLDQLFQAFYRHQDIIQHNKYANNYDYNKAVYLLNKVPILENGFILLKEDSALHSPIGVLFYEYYDQLDKVKLALQQMENEIQCKVGNFPEDKDFLPFGTAQEPQLWDYADGVDTLQFLLQAQRE